ncbi:MAG: ABC transporter ATP-binding protein [Campylobacterota bacterium]|nr:ABC transporter ATP-binding protein [Campylobacterota bacterium]
MLNIHAYSDSILHDINLSLAKEENLIILGSNGAGKSTLAKVLCGLTYCENIHIDDILLHNLSREEKTKAINYVPPKLEIFDEYLSTYEYLALSKLYSNLSIGEVLKLLNIQKLRNKSCKTLSSGEQQLILLASALLHHAKRTIFDEPTANLDPQKTKKVYELLKSNLFQNQIVITHDLTLASKLGYKILYMKEGKVVFFGESQTFFETDNLRLIFNNAVKKVDDVYVVNL